MTRVLLIRHGQSEWNADGRWQGQADPPLTDLGRHQALHAARNLGTVDAIVASDLQRASETALIIAEALGVGPVVLEPGLRERDAGEWSGLTRAEIERDWPGYLDPPPTDRHAGFAPAIHGRAARAPERRRPPSWEPDDVLLERVLDGARPGPRPRPRRRGDRRHPRRRRLRARGTARLAVRAARQPGGRWIDLGPGGELRGLGDRVVLVDPDELTVPARTGVRHPSRRGVVACPAAHPPESTRQWGRSWVREGDRRLRRKDRPEGTLMAPRRDHRRPETSNGRRVHAEPPSRHPPEDPREPVVRKDLTLAGVALRVGIVGLALATAYIHSHPRRAAVHAQRRRLRRRRHRDDRPDLARRPLPLARPARPHGLRATTIVGWAIQGPYYSTAFIAKGIEVALIVLVAVDFLRADGNPVKVAQREVTATPGQAPAARPTGATAA